MKKILRSTFGTLVVAAFLGLTPPIYAKGGGGHGGHGKHGKHFSSVSQRGGVAFSRGGSKFSRARSGKAYRSWGGRKWSGGYRADRAWNGGYWGGRNWVGGYWNGGNWNGGNWGCYPYWGWRYPYSYYSYYPYWYYPSYGYKYDDCSVSRRRYF